MSGKEQDYIIKTFYVLETSKFKSDMSTYELLKNKISGVRAFNDKRDSLLRDGLTGDEKLVSLRLLQFSALGKDFKRLVTRKSILHSVGVLRELDSFTLNKVLRNVNIVGKH